MYTFVLTLVAWALLSALVAAGIGPFLRLSSEDPQ
jgi:hypothetical protein